jgi:pilus assembly protein Flp/PilA
MMTLTKRLLADCSGASTAEYALILAVVGLGIGGASLSLGANVGAASNSQSTALCKMNFTTEGSSTTTGSASTCGS